MILGMLSDLQEENTAKGMDFTLKILKDFSDKLGFYKFKRKEDRGNFADKITFFYNLFSILINKEKKLMGDSSKKEDLLKIQKWIEDFNIKELGISLYDYHTKGIINLESAQNVKKEAYFFIKYVLSDILGLFVKQVSSLEDPFGKFVIIRKISGFFSTLDANSLAQAMDYIYSDSGDISDAVMDLLFYMNKEEFIKMLNDKFFTWPEHKKIKILELIQKLKITQCKDFLDQVSEKDYSLTVKKIVSRIKDNLK